MRIPSSLSSLVVPGVRRPINAGAQMNDDERESAEEEKDTQGW
jgi:hypothetical protein